VASVWRRHRRNPNPPVSMEGEGMVQPDRILILQAIGGLRPRRPLPRPGSGHAGPWWTAAI